MRPSPWYRFGTELTSSATMRQTSNGSCRPRAGKRRSSRCEGVPAGRRRAGLSAARRTHSTTGAIVETPNGSVTMRQSRHRTVLPAHGYSRYLGGATNLQRLAVRAPLTTPRRHSYIQATKRPEAFCKALGGAMKIDANLWRLAIAALALSAAPSLSSAQNGGFDGKVIEGVLTPAYEKAYKERWRQQTEEGQVHYDRLGHCEPPGLPRFLLEPYTHEFINLPQESYLINDFGPSIRRVLLGKEHSNLYGTHSWYGDTIGFWDGDKLVLNTKYLYPADFTRWSPMTSNQFESVEIWQLKKYDGGVERLEVQATFYDKLALVKPVNAVYAFRHATDLEKADCRGTHWECDQTSESYLDDKGVTNFHLPGEEGFHDGRGATMFPELPGQTRDPIYNTTLPTA